METKPNPMIESTPMGTYQTTSGDESECEQSGEEGNESEIELSGDDDDDDENKDCKQPGDKEYPIRGKSQGEISKKDAESIEAMIRSDKFEISDIDAESILLNLKNKPVLDVRLHNWNLNDVRTIDVLNKYLATAKDLKLKVEDAKMELLGEIKLILGARVPSPDVEFDF